MEPISLFICAPISDDIVESDALWHTDDVPNEEVNAEDLDLNCERDYVHDDIQEEITPEMHIALFIHEKEVNNRLRVLDQQDLRLQEFQYWEAEAVERTMLENEEQTRYSLEDDAVEKALLRFAEQNGIIKADMARIRARKQDLERLTNAYGAVSSFAHPDLLEEVPLLAANPTILDRKSGVGEGNSGYSWTLPLSFSTTVYRQIPKYVILATVVKSQGVVQPSIDARPLCPLNPPATPLEVVEYHARNFQRIQQAEDGIQAAQSALQDAVLIRRDRTRTTWRTALVARQLNKSPPSTGKAAAKVQKPRPKSGAVKKQSIQKLATRITMSDITCQAGRINLDQEKAETCERAKNEQPASNIDPALFGDVDEVDETPTFSFGSLAFRGR